MHQARLPTVTEVEPRQETWEGQGEVRLVEEGGEPEEEAAGEATANETNETFIMVKSGSGTESTSVQPSLSVSQPTVGESVIRELRANRLQRREFAIWK